LPHNTLLQSSPYVLAYFRERQPLVLAVAATVAASAWATSIAYLSPRFGTAAPVVLLVASVLPLLAVAIFVYPPAGPILVFATFPIASVHIGGPAWLQLPELTVVLNHLGFWPSNLFVDKHGRPRFNRRYSAQNLAAVESLARFPRVFVLLSGFYAFAVDPWPHGDLGWVTSALLAAFGPGRLLLASDFPWIQAVPGYAETVATIDAHLPGLDSANRDRIRGANAVELFGFR